MPRRGRTVVEQPIWNVPLYCYVLPFNNWLRSGFSSSGQLWAKYITPPWGPWSDGPWWLTVYLKLERDIVTASQALKAKENKKGGMSAKRELSPLPPDYHPHSACSLWLFSSTERAFWRQMLSLGSRKEPKKKKKAYCVLIELENVQILSWRTPDFYRFWWKDYLGLKLYTESTPRREWPASFEKNSLFHGTRSCLQFISTAWKMSQVCSLAFLSKRSPR